MIACSSQQQPVASVNGKNITTADFQKRVKFSRAQLNSQLSQLQAQRETFASDPQLAFITQQIDQNISSIQSQLSGPTTLGRQVLDSMVEDELVRQEAAKRSIKASPEEIQTNIEHSYNFYPRSAHADGCPDRLRPLRSLRPHLSPRRR